MNLKNPKGSITIFVLVGLLFMSAFLVVSYASNTNKSKVVQEQSNIIADVYYKGNDNDTYTDTYSALRKKHRQVLTAYVEDANIIKLTKTFEEELVNYRIYGSTEMVGDLIEDTTDSNYGKYKIPIKINEKNYIDEEKFTKAYGTIITEYQDYYEVSTYINTNGIYWDMDGDFKVGDKINAQAKVEFISTENELAVDSVTLRIRNLTKGIWIHSGVNGRYGDNKDFATITFNEPKTLKFSDIELTSDNFTEGDIIRFVVSRGRDSNYDNNTIIFKVYKGTVAFEKSNDSQSGVTLSGETYNIFLDNPLGEGDYIDFKLGKVIRIDGTEENISLPEIETTEDYTKIEVSTSVKPSKIEVDYVGYTL